MNGYHKKNHSIDWTPCQQQLTKITIDIQNFHKPADSLQELTRLEQLKNDFETPI